MTEPSDLERQWSDAWRSLAEGLRGATGALAAAVMRFEPDAGRLRVSHISAGDGFLDLVRRLLGQPIESLDLRPGAALAEIQGGPMAIEFHGLHQALFGQVPEEVSSTLELSLGIGRSYGLALRRGERLLGTASIFMPAGGGSLEVPELAGWAGMIAGALRQ